MDEPHAEYVESPAQRKIAVVTQYQYDRRADDVPNREEHNDLKGRVKVVEEKLDRMTWLIIATLVSTLADLYTKLRP